MKIFCLIAASAATIAFTIAPAHPQQRSDIGAVTALPAPTPPSSVAENPSCRNISQSKIAETDEAREGVKAPARANQVAPRGKLVARAPDPALGSDPGSASSAESASDTGVQDQDNMDRRRTSGIGAAPDNKDICETAIAGCCPQADPQCPTGAEDTCDNKQQTDTDYTPRLRDKYRPG